MTFAQPIWLAAGLVFCTCLFFVFRLLKKQRTAGLKLFASEKLLDRLTAAISPTRRRYKNILILGAVFMCFIALARPQYGYKWIEVKRKGIDLLFALDVSKSMLARDIKPNRLKRASLAILDFVQQLEGDRVGLMPFAGSAYLMCPLTLDYEAFQQTLAAAGPTIIPRGGTNLPELISKASETLENEANHKILIILTDGENLQGDSLSSAARAAEKGVRIFTVGVGTQQGELIPLEGGGFVKDRGGNFVTSKLDEQTLAGIAEKTGGLYVPLGGGNEGLEAIYQQKLALVPKEELAERRHKVPLERPEWPIFLALLLLCVEFCISERKISRRLPSLQAIRKSLQRGKKLAIVPFMVAVLVQVDVHAGQGEDAYARGDYLEAAQYYQKLLEKDGENPQLHYNLGTVSYKNNMLDDAAAAFSRALSSEDINLQQKAYFNLGSTYYQKGTETAQADPQKTVEQWEQAVRALDSALELNPQDQAAHENKAFIEKKLEELKKQQQEQEKDRQGDENRQQDDSRQDNTDRQPDNSGKNDKGQQQQEQGSTDDSQNSPVAGEEKDTPPAAAPQDSADDEAAQDNPSPDRSEQGIAQENQENDRKAQAADQAAEDAVRQQQGRMTREEAEQLLNALKNEEGELNFVPAPGTGDRETDKDW
jgi:Ca-activated chloride channel family protein